MRSGMSPAPHDRFQQLECIGRGSYGEVYRGIDKATGVPVALKVVELEDIDDDIESMHKEILTLAGCRSKNITDYYTSFLIPGTSQLCIAMELMACSVVDLIRVGELDERSIAYVLKETLQALDYLHSQNRIHRDIKAANVLVSSSGAVKLSDFGVSGQLTGTLGYRRRTFVGTPFWMAPEVIESSDVGYTSSADIWSLGITAIEMATGQPPNTHLHPMRALFLIPKDPPPVLTGPEHSATFKDFVAACLAKDHAERPSARKLLGHPFLSNATLTSAGGLMRLVASFSSKQRPLPPRGEHNEEYGATLPHWDFAQTTAAAAAAARRRSSPAGTTTTTTAAAAAAPSGPAAAAVTMMATAARDRYAGVVSSSDSLPIGAAAAAQAAAAAAASPAAAVRAGTPTGGGGGGSGGRRMALHLDIDDPATASPPQDGPQTARTAGAGRLGAGSVQRRSADAAAAVMAAAAAAAAQPQAPLSDASQNLLDGMLLPALSSVEALSQPERLGSLRGALCDLEAASPGACVQLLAQAMARLNGGAAQRALGGPSGSGLGGRPPAAHGYYGGHAAGGGSAAAAGGGGRQLSVLGAYLMAAWQREVLADLLTAATEGNGSGGGGGIGQAPRPAAAVAGAVSAN